MTTIPIMIDIKNKEVVVIGGGHIATRRLERLVDQEARLTVISPTATAEISRWADQELVTWKPRNFEYQDVEKAFMLIVATNDPVSNAAARKAAPPNCLVNAVAEAEFGNIHFPAHFTRGKLSIAVSTNGASPMLAKKINQELANQFDDRYDQYLEFLFAARLLVKKARISSPDKKAYLRTFLDESFLQNAIQQQTLRELQLLVDKTKQNID